MITHLKAKLVDSNPSDDEGLASVYFEYDRFKYLTLSYSPYEDDYIYFEKDDQITGINSNNVDYELGRNYLELRVGDDISTSLHTEKEIRIEFQVSDEEYSRLRESVEKVFSAKVNFS